MGKLTLIRPKPSANMMSPTDTNIAHTYTIHNKYYAKIANPS